MGAPLMIPSGVSGKGACRQSNLDRIARGLAHPLIQKVPVTQEKGIWVYPPFMGVILETLNL